VITKHGKPVVVILSMEDYSSLMETLDILTDPKAMTGLQRGMTDLKKGNVRSWKQIKKSLEKL
jgi:PHD/YefM family antitoxin component YafN of YafNO toxin-antitoxin module